MASFSELWDIMESDSPLMGTGLDSDALSVVRAGKDLRSEEESSFWDDFISLCSNSRGLSELLNVAPEKISNWPAKIHEMMEKLESQEAENPGIQDDTKEIPTGNNGAIVPTNMDPNLGSMT